MNLIPAQRVFDEVERHVTTQIPIQQQSVVNARNRVLAYSADLQQFKRSPKLIMYTLRHSIAFDYFYDTSNLGWAGLKEDMPTGNIFIVPPLRLAPEWCKKAASHPGTTALIVPARTDAAWFSADVLGHPRAECRFIEGRIVYDGKTEKEREPSVLVIYHHHVEEAPPPPSVQCPACLHLFHSDQNASFLTTSNLKSTHRITTFTTSDSQIC